MTDYGLDQIVKGSRSFAMLANRHPGGSLSSVEILAALFYGGMSAHLDPDPDRRDRFVQSKGHAASPLMYHLWATGQLGKSSLADVLTYGDFSNRLPRMPQRNLAYDIDLGTGSLGQGLSFGVGLSIADRSMGRDIRTYVLLGDGESTEGQVWEAAMTAERVGLANLTAIIDANGAGSLIKLDRTKWGQRWKGFGWFVQVVNGHDVAELLHAYKCAQEHPGPSVIIAETLKGRGLPPPYEDSNQLSSSIPSEVAEAVAQTADIDRGVAEIRRRMCGPIRPRQADPQRSIADLIASTPVGTVEVAKKIGGAVASAVTSQNMMFLSTDAIRNSGIDSHMNSVGEWTWDNPTSNVLHLAIAEQDAISVAAGLTSAGVRALYFSMEAFYWRALDQIRQSIAFADIPVVMVGTSGGVGDLLGPMVQSDSLLIALASLPGIEIYEASDANQAKFLIEHALRGDKPAYLRLPHEQQHVGNSLDHYRGECGSRLGYRILHGTELEHPDFVLAGAGATSRIILEAATLLEAEGIRCRAVEIYSVTEFGRQTASHRQSILSGATLTIFAYNGPSQFLGALKPESISIGVDDWGMSGENLEEIYANYGLTAENIGRIVLEHYRAAC